MTTILQTLLVAPSPLGNTDAAIYTSPTSSTAQIGRAVFCNVTASAVQVTAGITTGGALTAAQTMISARTIAPGESYVSPELSGAVILAGSKLHAYASAAASITFTASGLLIQ